MSEPVFTSALEGRTPPEGLAVSLSEITGRGMIDLRGTASDAAFLDTAAAVLGTALPLAPRSSAHAGDVTILWLSIDQWLVLTPRERTAEILAALTERLFGIFAMAIDMSDARTVIRLEGRSAREILMKATSVNLLAPEVSPGFVRRALFAEIAALIHVVDADVIDLYVFRSYADFAWRWLEKTATDAARVTLFTEQQTPPV